VTRADPGLLARILGALSEQGARLPALALCAGLCATPLLPRAPHRGPVPVESGEETWASPPIDTEDEIASGKLEDVLARAAPDLGLELREQLAGALVEEGRAAHLDPLLVLAVMRVESEFDEDATSFRGARGLMQLRPSTLAFLAKREGLKLPVEEIQADPVLSTRLAVRYLAQLSRSFHGDLDRTLMAYNAGPHRLHVAFKENDLDRLDRLQSYPRSVRRAYRRLQALPPGDDETVAERQSASLRPRGE
jgi:soluble lytic murein transglycosylase